MSPVPPSCYVQYSILSPHLTQPISKCFIQLISPLNILILLGSGAPRRPTLPPAALAAALCCCIQFFNVRAKSGRWKCRSHSSCRSAGSLLCEFCSKPFPHLCAWRYEMAVLPAVLWSVDHRCGGLTLKPSGSASLEPRSSFPTSIPSTL